MIRNGRSYLRYCRPAAITALVARLSETMRLVKNLGKGLCSFVKTGRTPEEAYHSLITLHCRTAGYSNDLLHWMVKHLHPPYTLPERSGVLGEFSQNEVKRTAREIEQKGYYVFPKRLPATMVQELVRCARTTPCLPLSHSAQTAVTYESSRPIAPRYDFSEVALLSFPVVQNLITDFSILSVAQQYLACAPILDIVAMWWSTAHSRQPSAPAGQLFHFDMDRIKWLKFFFYLTDVGGNNGPTCFVMGSHRRNGQPKQLLRHGYARITDEEVEQYYPRRAFIEFTGPAGTIIAVDTRGFHKGKALREGERLVLQLQYCDSLFGATYERTPLKAAEGSRLQQWQECYQRIYSRFS